jgi:hypothetical protein
MNRERALKVVLVLVGLIFLFGVYPLMMFLWSSGWRWQPNQPEYEQMILGVYATLGIFLLAGGPCLRHHNYSGCPISRVLGEKWGADGASNL